MTHELLETLDAVCPQWRSKFDTLRDAVAEFSLWAEYRAYMATADGRARALDIDTCPNVSRHNRYARQAYEKACRMVDRR